MDNFDRLLDREFGLASTPPKINRKRSLLLNKTPIQEQVIFNTEEESYYRKRASEIPNNPHKILEVNNLANDFYATQLDWNPNLFKGFPTLALAIGEGLFLYNHEYGSADRVMSISNWNKLYKTNNYLSSVKFNNNKENILAVGRSDGDIKVYDIVKHKRHIHNFKLPQVHLEKTQNYKNKLINKVNVMTWKDDLCVAGFNTGHIAYFDLRSNELVYYYKAHKKRVCSLEFSSTGIEWLASGGDNKTVNIFKNGICYRSFKEHKSAVKGLSFCPYMRDTIITGGGSEDNTVYRWDTVTGKIEEKIELNNPIANLSYSKNKKEFFCLSGYGEEALKVYDSDNFKEIKRINIHKGKALSGALSKDERVYASIGADRELTICKLDDKIF